jgi:hypothetical protein
MLNNKLLDSKNSHKLSLSKSLHPNWIQINDVESRHFMANGRRIEAQYRCSMDVSYIVYRIESNIARCNI